MRKLIIFLISVILCFTSGNIALAQEEVLPDLVVSSIQTPASASNNQQIEVSWTVKNQGNSQAIGNENYWVDALYLSTDTVLDSSDIRLVSYWQWQQPLAPGANYTVTYAFAVPKVTPGTYHILVKTDGWPGSGYIDPPGGRVYESNEDNNVFSKPITIVLSDLVVSSIQAPASASTNQQIEVSWTVKNQGNGIAVGTYNLHRYWWATGWDDKVYLSTDAILDSSDIEISSYEQLEQPLAPDASYTATVNLVVPKVSSGNYYLLIKTDAEIYNVYQGKVIDNVYESNESNNVFVRPIFIGAPDLVVSSIQTPTSAGTNQPIEVSWTVKNQGLGIAIGTYTLHNYAWATGWDDKVYLSTDAILDSSDIEIVSYEHLEQPLAPDASYTSTLNIAVPKVPSGNYYLLIKADTEIFNVYQGKLADNVYESNEANNVFAQPIFVGVPDLVVTSVNTTISANTPLEDLVSCSWTVKNQGNGIAVGTYTLHNYYWWATGWDDKVYLSTDATLDSSDTEVATYVHLDQPLAPNATYTSTLNVAVPKVSSGSYYLLIKTDAEIYNVYQGKVIDNVYESNDGNNVFTEFLALPDLMVASIDMPPSASAQQPINVSWTVKNQGLGKAEGSWTDALYLSSDAQLDEADTPLATASRSGLLLTGNNYTVTQTLNMPNVTAGNYYLILKTDSSDSIYESQKWNNVFPGLITIGNASNLSEATYFESNLVADLLSQEANLVNNATVSGDLNGTFNLTDLEIVSISSGPFTGKGSFQGNWIATLENSTYQGQWQGVSYLVAPERKVYLKGTVSGAEASGIVEGYFTESIPDSGVYDQYSAVWRLGRLGGNTASLTLNLEGKLSYGASHEYPSTNIYFLQAGIEGVTLGHYTEYISSVLTQLRVTSQNNPYFNRGFSTISYTTKSGSGEGWTYDKVSAPGRIEMKGMFTNPLLGILSGVLDETKPAREMQLSIERIDLGSPPQPDLAVKVWGPERVSPGQTINYIIEYRNDGVKEAENTTIIFSLDPKLKYISSTYSYFNNETGEIEMEVGTIGAKKQEVVRVTVEVPWGLPTRTPLENSAQICTTTKEQDLYYIDTISWRENVQPGDIILEHNKKSPVWKILRSYWTHGGGIVYGTKNDLWTGSREGYFVIEALPNDTRGGVNYGGVKARPLEFWDYPFKKEVVILRVEGLTQEQRDNIVNFWKAQIGKTYEDPVTSTQLDSSINANEWYCSELIRAPYFLLGMDFNTPAWDILGVKIAPDEINDSDFTLPVSGGFYDYRNLNINMDAFHSETIAARDPNIKYGPEGDVMPEQRLSYKVEYENEGEGIAFGVYFTDTLDEDLDDLTLNIGPVKDVSTGQQIGESGIYNPQTRTITWFVGEVASKQGGYAEFSVKVKSDAPDGAEVINFATVYFPSVPEVTRTNGIVNGIKTTLDNIAPTTTASLSSTPNQAGWNNSDVTITLTATDNRGGSGVKEIHYKLTGAITEEKIISGNSVDIPIYTEGTTTLTYYTIDNAGNTETAKTITLKLDKTPPTITAQSLPQSNSSGWNNSNVTVTFSAADSLSGVASVTEPAAITTEGKEQHVGGQAQDLAGNIASTYVTLNIDKTPPAVKITATPNTLWPPNHKLMNVTIGGSSQDNLSGIASNSFKVTDEYKTTEPLISSFNSAIKLEAWREGNDLDGRTYAISVTAKDKADNQALTSTTVICPHDQGKK